MQIIDFTSSLYNGDADTFTKCLLKYFCSRKNEIIDNR